MKQRRRLARFSLVLLFALSACACQHDVQLQFPEADAVSTSYECSSTTGPERCLPSTVVDPALQNAAGTEFVMMPKECQKHFHRVVIHGAGSSSPTAHVECAPAEGTLPPLTPITTPAAPSTASSAVLAAPESH